MKKNLCCQFDDTIEVYFLLGINIWGLCSEWVKKNIDEIAWKAGFRYRAQKGLRILFQIVIN